MMIGIIMIVLTIGLVTMWYTLHTIVYSRKNTFQKSLYFLLGSIVLYISLSYCFTELLKYRF